MNLIYSNEISEFGIVFLPSLKGGKIVCEIVNFDGVFDKVKEKVFLDPGKLEKTYKALRELYKLEKGGEPEPEAPEYSKYEEDFKRAEEKYKNMPEGSEGHKHLETFRGMIERIQESERKIKEIEQDMESSAKHFPFAAEFGGVSKMYSLMEQTKEVQKAFMQEMKIFTELFSFSKMGVAEVLHNEPDSVKAKALKAIWGKITEELTTKKSRFLKNKFYAKDDGVFDVFVEIIKTRLKAIPDSLKIKASKTKIASEMIDPCLYHKDKRKILTDTGKHLTVDDLRGGIDEQVKEGAILLSDMDGASFDVFVSLIQFLNTRPGGVDCTSGKSFSFDTLDFAGFVMGETTKDDAVLFNREKLEVSQTAGKPAKAAKSKVARIEEALTKVSRTSFIVIRGGVPAMGRNLFGLETKKKESGRWETKIEFLGGMKSFIESKNYRIVDRAVNLTAWEKLRGKPAGLSRALEANKNLFFHTEPKQLNDEPAAVRLHLKDLNLWEGFHTAEDREEVVQAVLSGHEKAGYHVSRQGEIITIKKPGRIAKKQEK